MTQGTQNPLCDALDGGGQRTEDPEELRSFLDAADGVNNVRRKMEQLEKLPIRGKLTLRIAANSVAVKNIFGNEHDKL
eukprot:5487122-Prorocentrum_lima.AAC.1